MKFSFFLCLFLLILTSQGCSYNNWYEGFRQGRINECNKLSDTDREQCLRETDISYETYQKERRKITE